MSGSHLVKYLLTWLRTFVAAAEVETVEDISDGLIISKVLYAISPDHFPLHWLGRLHQEPNPDRRSKARNCVNICINISKLGSGVIIRL
ncbi:hypothetical protein P879_09910 [Paragonimus westermani]|uniref:HOOK N-terminal domain-containing protein n=1 Tax=Paragonimus westermani TaxID=34504 RepID=A0A8T0D536_9TREM|nr:hypothetical protein P879_09910 [Paragonimus westermani]